MARMAVLSILVVIVGIMFGIFRSIIVRVGAWSKSYLSLSKRYDGTVAYSHGRPKLVFRYGEANCVLSNHGRNNSSHTQLTLSWPIRRLKFFASTYGPPSGFLNNWGIRPIDHKLAEKFGYFLYGNNPEKIERLINEATIWQLEQLNNFHTQRGMEVSLSGNQLKIIKPGFIKQELALTDFVRFGCELFDQFKLALSDDLEFVDGREPVILENVVCPVCSGKIDHDIVACHRCRTPHCFDCWEYNGSCAMFACDDTRYIELQRDEIATNR